MSELPSPHTWKGREHDKRWRVGRKLGRTVYRVTGGGFDTDECVGMMDTRELGEQVVAALNGMSDLRAKVEALPVWRPSAIGNEYLLRDSVLDLIDGGSDGPE